MCNLTCTNTETDFTLSFGMCNGPSGVIAEKMLSSKTGLLPQMSIIWFPRKSLGFHLVADQILVKGQ